MKKKQDGLVKVLIVDDYELITDGVAELLLKEEDIVVVGKAATREKLFHHLQRKEIDLILMDIEIVEDKAMNTKVAGIDLTKEVKLLKPSVKIIMLTQHNQGGMLNESLKYGADGYLLKENANKHNLAHFIRRVYFDNELMIDPKVNREKVIRSNLFSRREKQVVCLLVKDNNPSEIADILGIKYDTVREYLTNIRKKINVRSTTEIANYAHRNKICE